ncbi:immunity protein Imm33 domain-containing protein [Granulicella cerasi]
MTAEHIRITQRETCLRYEADCVPAIATANCGLAIQTEGLTPLHGLRHPVTETTTGWYIWQGEYSSSPDFFTATCTAHVYSFVPQVAPYLSLPPGYRFLMADGHIDIWFDPTLLNT